MSKQASNSIFIIRIWTGFVTTIRKETPDMGPGRPKGHGKLGKLLQVYE